MLYVDKNAGINFETIEYVEYVNISVGSTGVRTSRAARSYLRRKWKSETNQN